MPEETASSSARSGPGGSAFDFTVIPGAVVRDVLAASYPALPDLVRDAYLLHADGEAHNPRSHFLRFADRPRDRIIALAADLGPAAGLAGIKWIASWPDNVAGGIPRASAVLVLNRRSDGYPFCVMEASVVSAARTAASALLGLRTLSEGRFTRPPRIGFVGAGVIARHVVDMIVACGEPHAGIAAYDLDRDDAARLLARAGPIAAARPAASAEALIRDSEVVVFATTAARPHVTDPAWFEHAPVVLNISLRDLSPEIILAADNILDDVDHCLQADTSPHLAEQATGGRAFVTGTIAQAVRREIRCAPGRPAIFSPFGMGILDLAVGDHVFRAASRAGRGIPIPDFFVERTRW